MENRNIYKMILSILIPTITERKEQYNKLYEHIFKQIKDGHHESEVEIVSKCDNRTMVLGTKRDLLYKMAKGKYSVQIDDDDWIPPIYITLIIKRLKENPDCTHIGYMEHCNMNGNIEHSIHSNIFSDWKEMGIIHYRTPFFKDPILTSICQQIGVTSMGGGEDHDFARRLKKSGLLTKEVFIDFDMYYYSYTPKPLSDYEPRA